MSRVATNKAVLEALGLGDLLAHASRVVIVLKANELPRVVVDRWLPAGLGEIPKRERRAYRLVVDGTFQLGGDAPEARP